MRRAWRRVSVEGETLEEERTRRRRRWSVRKAGRRIAFGAARSPAELPLSKRGKESGWRIPNWVGWLSQQPREVADKVTAHVPVPLFFNINF